MPGCCRRPSLWASSAFILPEAAPFGFASWAFLGPVARDGLLTRTRKLQPEDWASGPDAWVMDFIAPYGHTWAMVDDLQRTALADHIVHATRRKPDGTIRKIGRWTGQNVRRGDALEKLPLGR